MTLCHSIDTLSMAFLDDELAAEERRELELHLLDCAGCRDHVEREQADLAMLRKALVAPPAPDMLKARIARALDAEDAAAVRRQRSRLSQWLLPGGSIAAAAAAILVFVTLGTGPSHSPSPITVDVARQETRAKLPLEVQGASTGPWLRDNFAPVEPPQFTEPGIQLLGGRLLPNGIANHDAALLSYVVPIGANRVTLTAIVLKDLRSAEGLNEGQPYRWGNLMLYVHEVEGVTAVTYVDPARHVGYVFASERLTANELLNLVASTDLIARARQSR